MNRQEANQALERIECIQEWAFSNYERVLNIATPELYDLPDTILDFKLGSGHCILNMVLISGEHMQVSVDTNKIMRMILDDKTFYYPGYL